MRQSWFIVSNEKTAYKALPSIRTFKERKKNKRKINKSLHSQIKATMAEQDLVRTKVRLEGVNPKPGDHTFPHWSDVWVVDVRSTYFRDLVEFIHSNFEGMDKVPKGYLSMNLHPKHSEIIQDSALLRYNRRLIYHCEGGKSYSVYVNFVVEEDIPYWNDKYYVRHEDITCIVAAPMEGSLQDFEARVAYLFSKPHYKLYAGKKRAKGPFWDLWSYYDEQEDLTTVPGSKNLPFTLVSPGQHILNKLRSCFKCN